MGQGSECEDYGEPLCLLALAPPPKEDDRGAADAAVADDGDDRCPTPAVSAMFPVTRAVVVRSVPLLLLPPPARTMVDGDGVRDGEGDRGSGGGARRSPGMGPPPPPTRSPLQKRLSRDVDQRCRTGRRAHSSPHTQWQRTYTGTDWRRCCSDERLCHGKTRRLPRAPQSLRASPC